MKTILIYVLLVWSVLTLHAQNLTQTVKGKVLDAQSNSPLMGVTVFLLSDSTKVVTTDEEGNFKLNEVPIGRQALKFLFLGYHEVVLPNVLVTSGKEVVLTAQLEERLEQSKEVVIMADADKDKPNNEMATLSTRGFNMEEVGRYAGGRNDPARLAGNFAGVSSANDSRNDIIIRGNAPTGLLWRLEGVAIPNPSHFSLLGATGGPVSILNNNLLANSDFMTSAFIAEYGNATSGVFDLKLRNGNSEKHEFIGQMGFNGAELLAEGPLNRNHKSSYLASYRYSTLAVFQALGISFGTTALPYYQDLSFKINLPNEKLGNFSVFGIAGKSNIELLGSKLEPGDLYGDQTRDTYADSYTGVVGLNHNYFINKNTLSKLTFAVSYQQNQASIDTLDIVKKVYDYQRVNDIQTKYTLAYSINKKINARHTVKTGIIADYLGFNLKGEQKVFSDWYAERDFNGGAILAQAFAQSQYKFNEQLTLNTGLHGQYFAYNQTYAVEPRVALNYRPWERHKFNIGYGLHNQLQLLSLYFYETKLSDGSKVKTNKDLDFTRSQHFVLGYDWKISNNLRLKAETYYQSLDKVPVETRATYLSTLNAGADFTILQADSLQNKGTGQNYGVELTVERFFSKGYYFLWTTSLFQSTYKGSDHIERNTAFNNNYIVNVLAGKEWKVSPKITLTFDTKATIAGGRRIIAIDEKASQLYHAQIYNYNTAFEQQSDAYYRIDVKFGTRINGNKVSHQFFADIQNVSNHKNFFSQSFNIRTNKTVTNYQLGLFPVIQYRLEF